MLGSQHQRNRPGREIIQFAPDHVRQVQSIIRAVQVVAYAGRPILEHHVKAAASGDNHLLKFFMRVACPLSAAGHIIQVIHALDVKGDVLPRLNGCQIAPAVVYLLEMNNLAIAYAHNIPL